MMSISCCEAILKLENMKGCLSQLSSRSMKWPTRSSATGIFCRVSAMAGLPNCNRARGRFAADAELRISGAQGFANDPIDRIGNRGAGVVDAQMAGVGQGD